MPTFPQIESIPLSRPPLELVVCQLRFPSLMQLETREPPLAFGERLRTEFPVTRSGHLSTVPADDEDDGRQPFWSFEDRESNWTVTLTSTFLSLETGRYNSRADFVARFVTLAGCVNELYRIPLCERIGVRYVNRIGGIHSKLPNDWPQRLPAHLLPDRQFRDQDDVDSQQYESRFHSRRTGLAIRRSFVEQGFAGVDAPELLADFDSYILDRAEFGDLSASLNELCALCYRSFRWAMGDLIDLFR